MILYGIKNCDSVKKARKFFEANDIIYTFHDFRVNGLNEEKVLEWLEAVDIDVLLNKRSATWKTLTEVDKLCVDTALLCKYPTLIKRPVLEMKERVFVGYKESEYKSIIL